ncbi:Uncharacterised protein [Mycobacterium tuberculosis]|nr:Uncharacterised protein [Mycobacterium tuberculosis]CKS65802.1 Uncharacterised protein [Mycobacterium tuberculosis]CKT29173.1 Uncharacterised protein [Mycobacterium tuberculosis]COW31767.1 Uncharacterised protein [Mycobacterium tuberculosis]
MGTASILVSTPPQMAASASPSTICCHARAMASAPDAHADTGVITPALACRSNPTAAAAPLGMYFCTVSGETAFIPRARISS